MMRMSADAAEAVFRHFASPPVAGSPRSAMATATATAYHSGQTTVPVRARDNKSVCLRSFEIMESGDLEDFQEVVHPDAVNHEAKDEPPESRGRGPSAFHATALWLRDAFADLRWQIHEVLAEDEFVAVHCTMSGHHVRAFVEYDANARVSEAFPPTGRTFATTQTHWFRVAGGQVIEHWANRDDLGTAIQLGWVPPSPLYLLRMAMARRRARRERAKGGSSRG